MAYNRGSKRKGHLLNDDMPAVDYPPTPEQLAPPRPTRETVDRVLAQVKAGEWLQRVPKRESIESVEFWNHIRPEKMLTAMMGGIPVSEVDFDDPDFQSQPSVWVFTGTPEQIAEARRIGYAYVDARAKELGYTA